MLYYILLGGNLGDVDGAMRQAVRRLERVGHVTAISKVVASPAWGYESASEFHNAVLALESELSPTEVLKFAKDLEAEFGRKPKTPAEGYADRPLDIDILFAADEVIDSEALTVPHPRLHLRRFTLVPLAELAPALVHPVLGKNVAELLSECPDQGDVRVVGDLFPCFEQ